MTNDELHKIRQRAMSEDVPVLLAEIERLRDKVVEAERRYFAALDNSHSNKKPHPKAGPQPRLDDEAGG